MNLEVCVIIQSYCCHVRTCNVTGWADITFPYSTYMYYTYIIIYIKINTVVYIYYIYSDDIQAVGVQMREHFKNEDNHLKEQKCKVNNYEFC